MCGERRGITGRQMDENAWGLPRPVECRLQGRNPIGWRRLWRDPHARLRPVTGSFASTKVSEHSGVNAAA